MDPSSAAPGDWLMRVLSPQLDDREKALRDKFVTEYLKDEDPYRAALRIGFTDSLAIEYAKKFLGEPYTQQQISARRNSEPGTPAEEREAAKRVKLQIKAALLKEAFYHGKDSTQAARVAALKTLATLEGMMPTGGGNASTLAPGSARGGVVEVPAMLDIDPWEKRAQASQQKLIDDASI